MSNGNHTPSIEAPRSPTLWFCAAAVALTAGLMPYQARAATLSTIVSFNGANGSGPRCTLVADVSGNLYGTTFTGGGHNLGTVFEIANGSHALTTLATFDGANGAKPYAGLTADAAGNLYGTTTAGGPSGYGTVFKLDGNTRALSTLAVFNQSNGASPDTRVLIDAGGNLFGTTYYGGSRNLGTVFELAKGSADVTTFTSFPGVYPQTSLLTNGDGDLIGQAVGTVFKITKDTHAFSTLATFYGGSEGDLISDSAGNLYGTLVNGGDYTDGGVFKISAGSNAFTILASFGSDFSQDVPNGSLPVGGLIMDADGNLFGTTTLGGLYGKGTVFRIDGVTNELTTLVDLQFYMTGSPSTGSLFADANGNLYGTTAFGTASLDGSIFEITDSGFVVPEPATLLVAFSSLALCRRARPVYAS